MADTYGHTFSILQVAKERAVRANARREDKVKAFRGWSRLKAITEAAVRCLQDIDAPTEKPAQTRAQECWLEVRERETGRQTKRSHSESKPARNPKVPRGPERNRNRDRNVHEGEVNPILPVP